MTEGMAREPATRLHRGLVDALCDLSFMRAPDERRLFVRELANEVGDLPDIRDSTRMRTHVIEIVQVCQGHPRGLRGLAATVTLFAPEERGSRGVLELIESIGVLRVVSHEDRRRASELLQRVRLLDVEALWYEASDETAPLPATPIRSLLDAFDHLASMNTRADGLPPVLALVEYVAARSDGALASELRQWNDEQAGRLGLTRQLAVLRDTAAAGPASMPTQPCLVIQLAEHGIDPSRYVLSSWVQYRPGRWNPERGEDLVVALETVESVVEELLNRAETVWGKQPGQAEVEFVLPAKLLNEAVDWWHTNSGSPEAAPLCLDYPVVVRSLERMRALNYHRFWRNRWEAMISAPSIRSYWALTDEDDIGLWNARLRADESIAAVILGEPPAAHSAGRKARFFMALRAGVPIIIWDRRTRRAENFEEIVERLVTGTPLSLVKRVRDLRSQAAIADNASSAAHIGRHLAVLVDDPNRLVDATPFMQSDIYGQVKEKFGNE